MAGYTQIERKLIDWVDAKYAKRIIGIANTEWELKLVECPPGVSEYQYMHDRILAIHREINMGKGDKIDNDEKSTTDV